MSLASLLSLIGVHIVGMSSPGPDILLVLRIATKSRKHALATVMGISTGAAVWLSLTVFGMAAVLMASPALMGAIQLLGGCYLAYMGYRMLADGLRTIRASSAAQVSSAGAEPNGLGTLGAAYRQGLLTNLSNPKIVLFLAAVLAQFIPVGAPGWVLVVYAAVLIITQILFFTAIAVVVSTQRVVRRMLKASPWIDSVAGLIFLVMGAFLIKSGISALL